MSVSSRPRELAERPRVESIEELGDRGVEFAQREERAVTKRGEDPALNDLHSHLGFGLIPRFSHARREHRDSVVAGQVVVGRIGVGLVAMGAAHR